MRTCSRSGADSGSQSRGDTGARSSSTAAAAPAAAAAKPAVELILARGEHPSQPILQDAPAHVATSQATGAKLNFQPVPDADWLAKAKGVDGDEAGARYHALRLR